MSLPRRVYVTIVLIVLVATCGCQQPPGQPSPTATTPRPTTALTQPPPAATTQPPPAATTPRPTTAPTQPPPAVTTQPPPTATTQPPPTATTPRPTTAPTQSATPAPIQPPPPTQVVVSERACPKEFPSTLVQGKSILTLPDDDLKSLDPILPRYNLSREHINLEKAVTFALPTFLVTESTPTSVLMMTIPLKIPSVKFNGELFAGQPVALGILRICRKLSIPPSAATPSPTTLPPGAYLVTIAQGQIAFVNGNNQTLQGERLRDEDVRRPTTQFSLPATIITRADFCYGWQVGNEMSQLCLHPSPEQLLTEDEKKAMVTRIEAVVKALRDAKKLEDNEQINTTTGVIADVVGGWRDRQFPTYSQDTQSDRLTGKQLPVKFHRWYFERYSHHKDTGWCTLRH